MTYSPRREAAHQAFDRLLDIMDDLRQQCPWDKKQTMETLSMLTIEETYELTEAIAQKDLLEIKKELGDVLLHIVFYAKIASETNSFDIADVMNALCEKLIHRHPHIYGQVKVNNEEEVKQNWEKLKLKEQDNQSILGGVPAALPAMIKAYRIQEKAKSVGFDWENKTQVLEKIHEEINEMDAEITANANNKELIANEFGDFLFAMINYARFIGINPEAALESANQRFIKRFSLMEQMAKDANQLLTELNINELEELWQKAKMLVL